VREDPKVAGLLYAGTERGVYVSFDDGDRWQPLQRNLPVTSVRDIAVHGNDLAVATHGRAFWIMDDVSSLRELAARPQNATRLFEPAAAYRTRPGNEEGTPLPLDEPQAANPPDGVLIDYALARETSPVDIDVIDPRIGKTVRHFSSADPPKPTDPAGVDVAPAWIVPPQLVQTTPGAHRFVWDFHAGTADGPLVPPGTYTIRLTAGAQSYEQGVRVLRDPRISATDADLREQYELSRQIEALEDRADASRKRAVAAESRTDLSPAQIATLKIQIAGAGPADDPDDSMGKPSHDFTSFLYLKNALANLDAAVQSADAAPTPDMRTAYAKLEAIFQQSLRALERIDGAHA
jgi:hypothetical protein